MKPDHPHPVGPTDCLLSSVARHGQATNGGRPVKGCYVFAATVRCWRCGATVGRSVRAPSAGSAASMLRESTKRPCYRCEGKKVGMRES